LRGMELHNQMSLKASTWAIIYRHALPIPLYSPASMGHGRPPHDPFAGVREPKCKRGPSGRTSAVALEEPRDSQSVNVIGTPYRRDTQAKRVNFAEPNTREMM
jgi:hypothetical protein